MKVFSIVFYAVLILGKTLTAQTTYPNNEDGQYEDMLTPQYYHSANGEAFRHEINKFIHFSRLESFRHPLADSSWQIPNYDIHRDFGDNIGPNIAVQHHPAIDLHFDNRETNVNFYAAYSGYVSTYRDAAKYRHYLSLTKSIEDDEGNVIGKMVSLYAHIDLDLDSVDNILMDGKFVNQGDIISKHLYSGTLGGPHLHFEIRYYRPGETGSEEFYGWSGGSSAFTEPSAGSWSKGYWDPNIGYGFANPENQINSSSTGIIKNDFSDQIDVFPNPTSNYITIRFHENFQEVNYSIINLSGKIIDQKNIKSNTIINIDLSNYSRGIYFVNLYDKSLGRNYKIRVIKK